MNSPFGFFSPLVNAPYNSFAPLASAQATDVAQPTNIDLESAIVGQIAAVRAARDKAGFP